MSRSRRRRSMTSPGDQAAKSLVVGPFTADEAASGLRTEPHGALRATRQRQTFAAAIVPLFVGVGLLADRTQAILADLGAADLPVRVLSLGLLIAALAYFASWYFGTSAEI